MLVLTRKLKEQLIVGDSLITVVSIAGDRIRLGIDAPKETSIKRREIVGDLEAYFKAWRDRQAFGDDEDNGPASHEALAGDGAT